jgi:hypothetical protein
MAQIEPPTKKVDKSKDFRAFMKTVKADAKEGDSEKMNQWHIVWVKFDSKDYIDVVRRMKILIIKQWRGIAVLTDIKFWVQIITSRLSYLNQLLGKQEDHTSFTNLLISK